LTHKFFDPPEQLEIEMNYSVHHAPLTDRVSNF